MFPGLLQLQARLPLKELLPLPDEPSLDFPSTANLGTYSFFTRLLVSSDAGLLPPGASNSFQFSFGVPPSVFSGLVLGGLLRLLIPTAVSQVTSVWPWHTLLTPCGGGSGNPFTGVAY